MPKVAIAADFLESFTSIPRVQRKKARKFVECGKARDNRPKTGYN